MAYGLDKGWPGSPPRQRFRDRRFRQPRIIERRA